MCIIIFINACTKPLPYLLLAFAHSLQYHFELFILFLWWLVECPLETFQLTQFNSINSLLSLWLTVEIFILKLYLICLRKYKEIRWRWFMNVILLFEWLINIHEEKVVNVCSISNILFKLPFDKFYIIFYIYENFGSTSMLIHVMIVYANAP